MSDRFQPIPMPALVDWIADELAQRGRVFGVPRELFFRPQPGDGFTREVYGQRLDTPFGVAAGPHSQMAQNIVVAWLCGARFIELKTVQTLDELEIAKPCIDMEDEGYNVEWSQELKVEQSFDEYLRAWILVHALHDALGFPGRPGVVFNISVGYNLEGIKKRNVVWFLERMRDAGELFDRHLDDVARRFPRVRELAIPRRMSDSVTLSTMHGCPPDEIGRISTHLIEDWGLHTSVKLNPTLLGPDRVRGILNRDLAFSQVTVPDEAFGHDLKWADAQPLIEGLRAAAAKKGVVFGVKLSNTLEVLNHRRVFRPEEKMMYLSGRPLHALTVNLADMISRRFDGELLMSFAGGADAFNAAHLLRAGMSTVTSCTDLLKSGGYLRLRQYVDNTRSALAAFEAQSLDELVVASARRDAWPTDAKGAAQPVPAVREARSLRESALANLGRYAAMVLAEPEYQRETHHREKSKTRRELGLFDCIDAPCMDECNIRQEVPHYMALVREGRFDEAVAVTREDNALASVLGRACDHRCEHTCVRTHYDAPLAIREMKRFIMEHEKPAERTPPPAKDARVAIVGAGPCGLSAAYFLARAGYPTTVYEAHQKSGGQVSGTIPAYRLPLAPIDQDRDFLASLGVKVEYGRKIGEGLSVADLRAAGHRYVIVAAGAQRGARLGLPGDDAAGVLDGLTFLRAVRDGAPPPMGANVVVVGGGDVAMDCARSARRLGKGRVIVAYRRGREEMPAQREEIVDLLAEGCELMELCSPVGLGVEGGRLRSVRLERMTLGPADASGRRRPVPSGQTFEVAADNLLLAIGQRTDLGLFGAEPAKLDASGYVVVDALTRETSLSGVFAGGDVIGESPLSIVKAMGDGKRIAHEIRRREEPGFVPPVPARREVDGVDLLRRRSERVERVHAHHRPADARLDFDEVVLGYTQEEAQAEAARCLDCDVMCSLCVSVCPNLAFFTYESAPVRVAAARLARQGDAYVAEGGAPFEVEQGHQVAVLTDFCNECGNCTTFCPTAGEPYRQKPRVYLHEGEFLAQQDNAFQLRADGIRGRFGGQTHELVTGEALVYRAPHVEATLDPATLAVRSARALGDAPAETTLRPAAVLHALFQGLSSSPFLPRAR